MAQPRYDQELKRFIQQWRPNDPALDERFMQDIRGLLAAIVKPPANVFEVTTNPGAPWRNGGSTPR